MSFDTIHIANQFAQHGDTVLTKMVNLPETQVNVNVSAPDVDSVTTFMSASDSSFVDSVYSALSDSIDSISVQVDTISAHIDSISSQIERIIDNGVGYPDWVAIIAIPIIIAVFSVVLPLLYSFITRLDEQYGSAVMATYMKGSIAFKSFIFWLIVALISLTVFAFNSQGCYTKCLLGISAVILVIATLRLIRHIFKVNTLEDIVNYLQYSIWSVFYKREQNTDCPIADFYIEFKSKCYATYKRVDEFIRKMGNKCKLLKCIDQLRRRSFDDFDLLYALCVRAYSSGEMDVEASVYYLYTSIIEKMQQAIDDENKRHNVVMLCSVNRFLERFFNKAFADDSKLADKKLISHFILCLYEEPRWINDYVIYMVTHNALNAIKVEEFWDFFFGEIDFGYNRLKTFFLTITSKEDQEQYANHMQTYLKIRNSLYLLYVLARTTGYNLKLYNFIPSNKVDLVATYVSLMCQIEDQQYSYLRQRWGDNELLQILRSFTKELYKSLPQEVGVFDPILNLSSDKLYEYAKDISDDEEMKNIIEKIQQNKLN